ncbi:MAG: NAD(P)H-hydrate epimerase [Candidatus Hydrogenedentes bacterium]|nr:NAD(P)H-hydrate epimerase [Candidatus Hydrogenedentota bacterium]
MESQIGKTLTAAQMREADRRCIEEIGIPGAVLMNNAGIAVFREIRRGPVGIVCGKGNNGGDGFVVARLALLAGLETRVVLVGDPQAVTGDAAVYMRVYENLGGRILDVQEPKAVAIAVDSLKDCSVLVDALLGTGTKGAVRDPMRAAILAWPKVHTVAVDLPSGLDADTGEPCGCCVRADVTVTFQFPKRGFENRAAREYIGRLVVADIGIPEMCAAPGFGVRV